MIHELFNVNESMDISVDGILTRWYVLATQVLAFPWCLVWQLDLCSLLWTWFLGIGKSSLMLRFCYNEFSPLFISTIRIDFKFWIVEVDGYLIWLLFVCPKSWTSTPEDFIELAVNHSGILLDKRGSDLSHSCFIEEVKGCCWYMM